MKKQNLIIQKDTDHLVTINRNGVWIKEFRENNLYIINADRLENNYLIDVSINIMTAENEIKKKELRLKRPMYH